MRNAGIGFVAGRVARHLKPPSLSLMEAVHQESVLWMRPPLNFGRKSDCLSCYYDSLHFESGSRHCSGSENRRFSQKQETQNF